MNENIIKSHRIILHFQEYSRLFGIFDYTLMSNEYISNGLNILFRNTYKSVYMPCTSSTYSWQYLYRY
jgi:hypothetical protein